MRLLWPRAFFAATALAWAATAAAETAVEFDLTRETRRDVAIAVPAFVAYGDPAAAGALGESARKILENDLSFSEFFQIVKPADYESVLQAEKDKTGADYAAWAGTGAQWLIKTEFAVDANTKSLNFIFRLYDIVNSRFVVGKRYRGDAGMARRIIHRFADETVEQLTGVRGVADTWIAFVAGSKEKREIYAVDFDGYNPRKVTNEKSITLSPSWSPDAQRLVYTSYADRNPDLIMLDLARNKRWSVLRLPGLNTAPAWAPDGKKIALVLSKDQNSEIYLLDVNNQLRRLTRHFNIDTSPAWSPDGRKIAFTSDRSGTGAPQIYIMDAQLGDDGPVERITFESAYNDNPAWSPRGGRVAYVARDQRFHIKIYEIDSKKTVNFTPPSSNSEEPTWSPDGRFIAFRSTENKRTGIYVKNTFTGKLRLLYSTKSTADVVTHPVWSPFPR